MLVRSYKGLFISIRPGSIRKESSQRPNPVANISVEEGGETLICLFCPSAFSTYKEAEDYCFQMAEKWIDEHLSSTPSLLEGREVHKTSFRRYEL